MKKFLALLLVCLIAFAAVSCDEEPTAPSEFEVFEKAISQTLASNVRVETKMTIGGEVLESWVETVFHPDGSADITYYIDKIDTDFDGSNADSNEAVTVTLNKDGTYSDGGAFVGQLGENVASVKLNLDAAKLDGKTIEGGVLSASVKAENTAQVFGREIGADVNFVLTVSENRVISLSMNYTTELGPVEVLATYN